VTAACIATAPTDSEATVTVQYSVQMDGHTFWTQHAGDTVTKIDPRQGRARLTDREIGCVKPLKTGEGRSRKEGRIG